MVENQCILLLNNNIEEKKKEKEGFLNCRIFAGYLLVLTEGLRKIGMLLPVDKPLTGIVNTTDRRVNARYPERCRVFGVHLFPSV